MGDTETDLTCSRYRKTISRCRFSVEVSSKRYFVNMTENIREREKIAREIEKTSESIRKKHRALKTGKIDDDIAVKTRFKPIIEPLQKIVDSSSMRAIKDEPELSDNDDVKTLSVQKREEEDAKCSKRKRSNTSSERKSKRLDGLDASPITSTPSATTVQPTMSLANEDVFETTDDSLAVSVQNQTLEGQNTLQEQLGPLSQKYVGAILTNDRKSDMDRIYGVYFDKDGMMFGSKRFDVDKTDKYYYRWCAICRYTRSLRVDLQESPQ